jgi:hypothetical protein
MSCERYWILTTDVVRRGRRCVNVTVTQTDIKCVIMKNDLVKNTVTETP